MPWVEARLRGQKVLARANADGSLASEGGRVEIRYKASDPRAYRAAAGNLKVEGGAVLPDSACVPGEAVAPKGEGEGGASARPARTTSRGGMPTKAAAKASGPRAIRGRVGRLHGRRVLGNPGRRGSAWCCRAWRQGRPRAAVPRRLDEQRAGIRRSCAVEGAPADGAPLVVHTDSQYAIGVLQRLEGQGERRARGQGEGRRHGPEGRRARLRAGPLGRAAQRARRRAGAPRRDDAADEGPRGRLTSAPTGAGARRRTAAPTGARRAD